MVASVENGISGFSGCLKEIYVGYRSILSELLNENSTEVKASAELRECPISPVISESVIPEREISNKSIVLNEKPMTMSPAGTAADPWIDMYGDYDEYYEEKMDLEEKSEKKQEKETKLPAETDVWVGQFVNTCEELKCHQGTQCITDPDTGESLCSCEGTGYSGRLCQFCEHDVLEIIRSAC